MERGLTGAFVYSSASRAWRHVLRQCFYQGDKVAPREQLTREILANSTGFLLDKPIVESDARKLNYRFMAAEALWILSGDNTVAGIEPWNKKIRDYSDNGVTFYGAYGPPIVEQMTYVVQTLLADTDTRQAGMTIWRPRPIETKDVPCTLALWFMIRAGKLDCHAMMRSSDAFIGLPYDFFTFSMVAYKVGSLYNNCLQSVSYADRTPLKPGKLFWLASSSHLYERDSGKAEVCINEGDGKELIHSHVLPFSADWSIYEDKLLQLREGRDVQPTWRFDHA